MTSTDAEQQPKETALSDSPLPQKVLPESELALLNGRYIQAWGEALSRLPLNEKQRQAIRNYIESAHRIAKRRVQVTKAVGAWRPQTPPLVIPTEEAQHMIYDLYESYYQSVYNAVSKLAGVVVLFPEVFGQPPVRSMEKFLKHFAELEPGFEGPCGVLEKEGSTERSWTIQPEPPSQTG